MTNGAGEEKTISVRNNLIEIYGMLKSKNNMTQDEINTVFLKVLKVINQVSRIHDNLEEAEKNQWDIGVAMDEIGDELYFNGVYTHEV
ncbi:DNA binding protein [Bacillus phage Curly]|uniref:Uncharacterized protein n=1 Tax=Bacillus phage Curly TaxID=2880541 RepID=M1HMK0_9CAUD|nr:DNA binding protein [Bacillus phage Curly]AGE60738.1 hypothetical protein CURLY_51 [Bacillus phage Curly]